jgi:hypothetical protein
VAFAYPAGRIHRAVPPHPTAARARPFNCTVAFELLELNGADLRRETIEVRKATLAGILRKSRPGVRLNDHLEHPEGDVQRTRKMTHDPMHPAQEPEPYATPFGGAPRRGRGNRSGRPPSPEKAMPHAQWRGGSGGPKGARNGNYKRGLYMAEAIASRRWLRQKIRQVRALTKTLRNV